MLYKNSLSVSNVQLELRTTDIRVGKPYTHTLSISDLLYLSSQAPDTYYTIGRIVYLPHLYY